MPPLSQVFWTLLLCVNLAAFLAFGWDKRCAIRGTRRIPERTLLLLAVAMGAAGAWAGLKVFRHKSQKRSFQWKLVVATLFNGGAVALWLAR